MADDVKYPGLPLAEVVSALRSELRRASAEREENDVELELESIDLEFHVGVTRDVEAKSGVRFWVVEVGGTAGRTNVETHAVRLRFSPRDHQPIRISGQRSSRPD